MQIPITKNAENFDNISQNIYGLPSFDDLVNREEKNDFLKIIEDEYYCSQLCLLYIGFSSSLSAKIMWV